MTRSMRTYFLMPMLSMASFAIREVIHAVERFVSFLIDTLASASPFAMAVEFGSVAPRAGIALDRSLLTSLRHEANVSRRSADRHI